MAIDVSREAYAQQIIDIETAIAKEPNRIGRGATLVMRRQRLTPILNELGVQPALQELVFTDSGLLYPQGFSENVSDKVDIYYGIAPHRGEYGVCDPETLIPTQRRILEDLYPVQLLRMARFGPPVPVPLSLDELRELGRSLNISEELLRKPIPEITVVKRFDYQKR